MTLDFSRAQLYFMHLLQWQHSCNLLLLLSEWPPRLILPHQIRGCMGSIALPMLLQACLPGLFPLLCFIVSYCNIKIQFSPIWWRWNPSCILKRFSTMNLPNLLVFFKWFIHLSCKLNQVYFDSFHSSLVNLGPE